MHEKGRQSENEDFLTNPHGDFNLIFPQGAASLNLSEFKFNEKYPPVRSEKSAASCRDGCFGKPVASAPGNSDKAPGLKVR